MNHPFPTNFVQMQRRIPPGQNPRVNPIAMVHPSQIQNMHNWNDSRKGKFQLRSDFKIGYFMQAEN